MFCDDSLACPWYSYLKVQAYLSGNIEKTVIVKMDPKDLFNEQKHRN